MGVGAKRGLEDRTSYPTPVSWVIQDLGTVKASANYIAKGCLGDVLGVMLPDLA